MPFFKKISVLVCLLAMSSTIVRAEENASDASSLHNNRAAAGSISGSLLLGAAFPLAGVSSATKFEDAQMRMRTEKALKELEVAKENLRLAKRAFYWSDLERWIFISLHEENVVVKSLAYEESKKVARANLAALLKNESITQKLSRYKLATGLGILGALSYGYSAFEAYEANASANSQIPPQSVLSGRLAVKAPQTSSGQGGAQGSSANAVASGQ